jgi:hypothetical protein
MDLLCLSRCSVGAAVQLSHRNPTSPVFCCSVAWLFPAKTADLPPNGGAAAGPAAGHLQKGRETTSNSACHPRGILIPQFDTVFAAICSMVSMILHKQRMHRQHSYTVVCAECAGSCNSICCVFIEFAQALRDAQDVQCSPPKLPSLAASPLLVCRWARLLTGARSRKANTQPAPKRRPR